MLDSLANPLQMENPKTGYFGYKVFTFTVPYFTELNFKQASFIFSQRALNKIMLQAGFILRQKTTRR
jgi:hypothetical protein